MYVYAAGNSPTECVRAVYVRVCEGETIYIYTVFDSCNSPTELMPGMCVCVCVCVCARTCVCVCVRVCV